MSVPILDRQAPGGGGCLPATSDDDVAATTTTISRKQLITPQATGSAVDRHAAAVAASSGTCGLGMVQTHSIESTPALSSVVRGGSGGDEIVVAETSTRSLLDEPSKPMHSSSDNIDVCDKNKQQMNNTDAQEEANQTPRPPLPGARRREGADEHRSVAPVVGNEVAGAPVRGPLESNDSDTSKLHFKPPNPIHDSSNSKAAASSRGMTIDFANANSANMNSTTTTSNITSKQPTRHHSTVEMSSPLAAGRMQMKRKTSVFSQSGFMALHKLDQSALKQHSLVSTAVVGSTTCSNSYNTVGGGAAQMANAKASDDVAMQQVDDSQPAKVVPASSSQSSMSPRRANRSDTLGSTGSSRASSCDEPTILSPTTKVPVSAQHMHSSDLELRATTKGMKPTALAAVAATTNLIPSLELTSTPPSSSSSSNSSLDSLAKIVKREVERQDDDDEEDAATPMQCDDIDEKSSASISSRVRVDQQQQQENTSDEEEDDDEDDDEEEGEMNVTPKKQQQKSMQEQLKIPPFESIKTQIKRNSIPNAEDIKRHIDKVIRQNEEIVDNWNQVSIRSYNSSSSNGGSGGGQNTTTTAASITGSGGTGNKRPSKRWSTTALCTKGSGIVLNQLPSCTPTTSTILADSNNYSKPIERKRSHILNPVRRLSQQQRPPKMVVDEQQRHPASSCLQPQPQSNYNHQQHVLNTRQTNATSSNNSSCCALSPTTQVSLSMPSSPNSTANPYSDMRHVLQNSLERNKILEQQQQLLNQNHRHHQALTAHQPFHHHSQTIESAIENLSLKKRDEDLQQHNTTHDLTIGHTNVIPHSTATTATATRGDDLVMAAILVERQRQQQLLEDYLRHRAASDHLLETSMSTNNNNSGNCQSAVAVPLSVNPILDHYQLQQQRQLLEQQLSLSRLAAIESEYQQQRQQAMASLIAAASIQQHSDKNSNQLSPAAELLAVQQRQALENQLLNEHLAKMMLSRRGDNNNHHHHLPKPLELADIRGGPSPAQPFQVSPTSPSRVYLRHGSELQTQSLDSATPSYRCEACDISFWTRDLLNYHSMTSCSARIGPRPSKPIAFNFNQPNGFDSQTAIDRQQQILVNNSNINKVLSCGNEILRLHKTACLGVTSLLSIYNDIEDSNSLFVGTSAGMIIYLTISLEQLKEQIASEKPSWNPRVISLRHGHSGQVRFLRLVELLVDSSDSNAAHGESSDDNEVSIKASKRNLCLVSGGSGIDLYGPAATDAREMLAQHPSGDNDSLNHLILWEL